MGKMRINLEGKRILVTGAAGFIGANLAKRLCEEVKGGTIIGVDNMNEYYDIRLKLARLEELSRYSSEGAVGEGGACGTSGARCGVGGASGAEVRSSAGGASGAEARSGVGGGAFLFLKGDIGDKGFVDDLFAHHKPHLVVNLAAQAGVRYSITNPEAYIDSNIVGFFNILEACRHSYDNVSEGGGEAYCGVEHLIYASSSSVYGSNEKVPYSTDDKVDNPVSLYAATKKSNELMAHAYSKLYDIPSTGLRFFTVYGPAGRPDMAYFGFTDKLVAGKTIEIFNYGNCKRDFTYIDDIVEGIVRVMRNAPSRESGPDGLPVPPYALYNIGNSNPENLLEFVDILQQELVRAGLLPEDYDFEAHRKLVPMQPGDVPVTYADTSPLEADFGFKPFTPLREGLRRFAEWYATFYKRDK